MSDIAVCTDLERLRVTKANQLIEVILIETTTRLSLRDQKVVLAVVSQLSPDDDDFKKYRLSISDLVQLTKINKNNLYAEIDMICARLMSSVIRIMEPDNPHGFLMVTWFSHARYLPGEGVVEFSISPELTPYLLKMQKNFTSYNLEQVVNLQSVYSIRMYELLRQFLPLHYVEQGKVVAWRELDLSVLRKCLGVMPGKYCKFYDFRRYVLERAKSDLEEKTDLAFDFDCIRKGRKVGAIKFIIRHNECFETSQAPEMAVASQPVQPIGIDDGLASMVRLQLPDIADDELHMLAASHSRETVVDALLSLAGAIARQEIKATPYQFFLGVLAKKRREKPREHQTTLEKLTDRSWAVGLEVPPQ